MEVSRRNTPQQILRKIYEIMLPDIVTLIGRDTVTDIILEVLQSNSLGTVCCQ